MEIKEKIGAIRLKNTLNASGRNIAIAGMQAGQAPKKTPMSDPTAPLLIVSIEQHVEHFDMSALQIC